MFLQNGEVADVPVDEAAPTQQWAQPVQADPLANSFAAQDSIFCAACLKNQHIYNYTLSQYLPDPDHPDHDRLEAALPDYKKGLEQRYPQCCAKCEPKVKAQLQQATYNARSDHLRRVLEKSRQRRIASCWGWRSLLVNAAGLGYVVSLGVQVLWHFYGSQVTTNSSTEQLRPADCLRQHAFPSQCLDTSEPFVGLALVLGLLCVWWNPKWHHKLRNSEGRLVNLHEYYLTQFLLLGLRFSAWILLFHMPIALRAKAMLHACSAVALLVLAGWSVSSIVKVRMAPPVNWHQDPAPLLASKQFIPPPSTEPLETQRPQDRPFSVNSLAGPSRPTYRSWNPPTPPPDSAEAMDWTPSQPAFQPQSKNIRYTASEPSPFHGTLPTLNAKGIHRNPNQAQSGRQAIGLPRGFFDKTNAAALPSRQNADAGEVMAQPTFFGHNRESDTGLESIFDTVFSIQDRHSGEGTTSSAKSTKPVHSFQRHANGFEVPIIRTGDSHSSSFSGASMFFALVGLAVLIFEAAVNSKPSQLSYCLVLISTIIPLGHIAILVRHGATNHLNALLLYTLEASALVGLAMLHDTVGDLFRGLWDEIAIGAVGLLIPQEYVALNRSFTRSEPLQQPVQPSPAPCQSESRTPGKKAAREPTMAERSYAIMPGLVQPSSNNSDVSDRSDSATTEANPWEPPTVQNPRYEYFEPVRTHPMTAPRTSAPPTTTNTYRNKTPARANQWHSSSSLGVGAPPKSNGNPFGFDGLGVGNGSGVSRNENMGITSLFGRNLNLSSPGSNSRPRERQRL